MPAVYAVDFESFYDKKNNHTAQDLGVWGYLNHPLTDIYLVSIWGPGVQFVGHPSEAPWALIAGTHWVSHNAAFDATAWMALQRRGVVSGDYSPCEWDCTANMAAYLGAPRSLAAASAQLLAEKADKTVRTAMSGVRWEQLNTEQREALLRYGLRDAELCYLLWENYNSHWPEFERRLSRHTMTMCLRGICIDRGRVAEYLQAVEQALWRAEQDIPWAGTLNARGKPVAILSIPAMRSACAEAGIPPPFSTADSSQEFEEWLEKYAEVAPFVTAVKAYRRLNRTREILLKFEDQSREDGILRYSLKYAGAHTLRWSGDSGLNFHNFPRDALYLDEEYRVIRRGKTESKDDFKKRVRYSIDLRGCLVPRPGYKFIVSDLRQIEARVTLWYAEDWEQLELVRNGMDVYEAHARKCMGYVEAIPLEEWVAQENCPNPNMRQFAKCRVLGLGFGLGHKKFVIIVRQWTGLRITETESKSIVMDFRRKGVGITRKWAQLERAMREHALRRTKEPFVIEMPNGLQMPYFDVECGEDSLKARDEMGGPLKYFYGGKIFENLVQRTARDILGEQILAIEDAGFPVLLHVHDEIITEVPIETPIESVTQHMNRAPEWAVGLPVACSGKEMYRYAKG